MKLTHVLDAIALEVLHRLNEQDAIIKSVDPQWLQHVDAVVDFAGKNDNGITHASGCNACRRLVGKGFVRKDKEYGYLVTQEGEQELIQHRSFWK